MWLPPACDSRIRRAPQGDDDRHQSRHKNKSAHDSILEPFSNSLPSHVPRTAVFLEENFRLVQLQTKHSRVPYLHELDWMGTAFRGLCCRHRPAGQSGCAHVDSNLATAVRTTVVVIFAWGIALALGKHAEIRSLDRVRCSFLRSPGWPQGCRGCATFAPCN